MIERSAEKVEKGAASTAVAESAAPAGPAPYLGFPLAENGRQITFSYETPEYDEVKVIWLPFEHHFCPQPCPQPSRPPAGDEARQQGQSASS